MIICRNCGKVKTYKTKVIVTREVIHSESGMVYDVKFVSEKNGEPRCPKCGRLVKFFKDEGSKDK